MDDDTVDVLLQELDAALRPVIHERRVASYGALVHPTHDEGWEAGTGLVISRRPLAGHAVADNRRYADGISAWLLRSADGTDAGLVFDRPAGSERDLVVLASVTGAHVVQRHPSGVVRIVGPFGVARWNGVGWHRVRHVNSWAKDLEQQIDPDDVAVLELLLGFAVHDLGSRGIGSLLLLGATEGHPALQDRLPPPPPLELTVPADLAPLRHALAQVDGAAVFDRTGRLTRLGARLVPSPDAERTVPGFGGMRHTAGRRYTFDDPAAIAVVVSEDGPVTVFREGALVARSTGESGA